MPEQERPTPEQVRAWAECANKATPGPWEIVPGQDFVGMRRAAGGYWEEDSSILSPDNAEFIVSARTAVPALCGEVERLRERERVLGEACQFVVDFAISVVPTRLIATLDAVIERCRAALAASQDTPPVPVTEDEGANCGH